MIDPIETSDLVDESRIARFVFQSGHIRGDGTPKSGAFSVRMTENELSVAAVDELTDDDIHWIRGEVEGIQGRQAKGWVELSRKDIKHPLDVDVDNKQYVRHANIIGWPDSRDSRMLHAQTLAQRASKLRQ